MSVCGWSYGSASDFLDLTEDNMAKDEVSMHIIKTEDLTLANTLLCFEGVCLVERELAGTDKRGRPLCRFVIGSPDGAGLDDLVRRHNASPDGIPVPTKKYDSTRRRLITPIIQEARELHE